MKTTLVLDLPYPPVTGNHAVKHNRAGGHYLTDPARAYIAQIAQACRARGFHGKQLVGPFSLRILAAPPNDRRRDAENAIKPLLDALVKADVLADDSNRVLRVVSLEWTDPVPPAGALTVVLEEL